MTEVTTPATFEEKMMSRIRDSIGDLISDEELAKLVERGIEENFFKSKTNPKWANAYNNSVRDSIPQYLPSLMETIVTQRVSEKVEELVKIYVDKWVLENADKVEEIVKQMVENGAGQLLIKQLNQMFQGPFLQFQTSMQVNMSQLQSRVAGFHPTY